VVDQEEEAHLAAPAVPVQLDKEMQAVIPLAITLVAVAAGQVVQVLQIPVVMEATAAQV
jgi:hypothetical protein